MSFTDTAPHRFSNSVDLAASVITKVTWTSREPRGVGTTRSVDTRGGIIADEEFPVWEPFTRMAFRFNERSTRDADPETRGPAKLAMFVARPLLNLPFPRFLTNRCCYTDNRIGAAPRRR